MTMGVKGLLFTVLAVTSYIDIKKRTVPELTHVWIIGMTLLTLGQVTMSSRWLGLVVISVPLMIIALLTKALGGGDVKLFATLGFLLGVGDILSIAFFAFVIAAGYALFLMIVMKKSKKTAIPFVPFITLGVVLTVFFNIGQYLLWAYY